MKGRVVVVDDDEDILALVESTLGADGFAVRTVQKSQDAMAAIADFTPDIVILDRLMPEPSGDELCAAIAGTTRPPRILMLTALAEVDDIVVGLDAGADDYLPKPFSDAELCARVRALARRHGRVALPIEVDEEGCRIRVDGEDLRLTATEYRLFSTLLSRPGRVYSRSELLDVCVHDYPSDRTIDAHLKSLRAKLGKHRGWIATVRGIGYRFDGPGPGP